jgi:hypothetical protein
MPERKQRVASDYAISTDGPVPPLILIMSGVFMAGLIALGYVHTVHADTPFARKFLTGGRFWIAVSFYLFLCAMVTGEIHRVLVDRRKRRAQLEANAAASSAPPGSSDA